MQVSTSKALLLAFLCCGVCLASNNDPAVKGAVVWDSGALRFVSASGTLPQGAQVVAKGSYLDFEHTPSGFGEWQAAWQMKRLALGVHSPACPSSTLLAPLLTSISVKPQLIYRAQPVLLVHIAPCARVLSSCAGKLRVVADDASVDAVLRYRAAGFMEGYLTAQRIWDHFRNTRDYFEHQL